MELLQRKPMRPRRYDYSQNGAYFLTICVADRQELLGKVVGAGSTRPQIRLSDIGVIVERHIVKLSEKYPFSMVDKYVVMPNHIHLLMKIERCVCAGRGDPAPTIGQIVGFFKYNTIADIGIKGFWQRGYHDHIIRDESDYLRIWQYIDTNTDKRHEDIYYRPVQEKAIDRIEQDNPTPTIPESQGALLIHDLP